MDFLPMKQLISVAAEHKFAIPSFCAWNGESLKMILETAQELKAPVIVMNGPLEHFLFKPAEFAAIAYGLKRKYSIPAALLLDHGDSFERVWECVEAGYTSVMLDLSTKPFDENAGALKKVCQEMHSQNITVEGEIGTVGHEGVDVPDSHESALTDVDEAGRFVEETGIDIVAVSIGNIHGIYKGTPNLRFDLLEQIKEAVKIPIALHGSSGLSEEDIKKAVSLGIAKVNIATELVKTVKSSLLNQWASSDTVWMPVTFSRAYNLMKPVIAKWIRSTGAEGKAGLIG